MKRQLEKILAFVFRVMLHSYQKYVMTNLRSRLKSLGVNVRIPDKFLILGHDNIQIGNNVSLGMNVVLFAAEAELTIENNVIFGPNVSIFTGNHNISVLGQPISEVKVKLPSDDLPVTICEGVWVGAGAIILKGVTIGHDSVIGAGAVVTKSVEPYTIYAGNPACLVKRRFNPEQEKLHITKNAKENSADRVNP